MNSISISWDYENNMNNDDFKGAVAVRAQFSSAAQSRPTLSYWLVMVYFQDNLEGRLLDPEGRKWGGDILELSCR